MTSELTTVALNLARNAGYATFPVGADKKPAIPEYQGGHGFLDATTDPERIKRLFSHRNAAHVGVATGAASGISVLDVDAGRWPDDASPKIIEKHQAARAWWHANADRIPATRIYESASGGLHVYFRHRPGIVNSQSVIHQGIDTRGDGGYVVFWFASGFACLDNTPPAEWPSWLIDALTAPKPKPPARGRPTSTQSFVPEIEDVRRRALKCVRSAAEGEKHERLRDAALLLGGIQSAAKFSNAEALEWLKDVLPDTVKDWKNVEKTVAWGLERGRETPLEIRRAS